MTVLKRLELATEVIKELGLESVIDVQLTSFSYSACIQISDHQEISKLDGYRETERPLEYFKKRGTIVYKDVEIVVVYGSESLEALRN